jgi:hypothetical protein
MILFVNVLITEQRLHHHERQRGYLGNPPRIDVYKYMLDSLAVIPHWTKAVFHVKLGEEFAGREEELKEYTLGRFDPKIVSYYHDRLEYQKDWRHGLQEVMDDPDPLTWFLCNDDHIFIDYDLDTIEAAVEVLEPQRDKMASFFFSHYPEGLKAVAHQGNQKGHPCLGVFDGGNVDSIQIVTKKVLDRWFYDQEDTNRHMPRPDWFTGCVKTDLTCTYVPLKECCRHFEGYPLPNININICPPLDIPPGFFDNNIKINFGAPKRPEQEWVWFNPTIKNYRTVDENGVDYKWVPQDIPLFWKQRVATIDNQIVHPADKIRMIWERNEAMWEMAISRPNQPDYVIDRDKVMAVAGRKFP